MTVKFCRFCDTALPAGEPGGRPLDFCNEDHRQLYQEKIQRETVDRLRSAQSAVGHGAVLQAGPPPGLVAAPPLRGVRRDTQTVTEVETAVVVGRGVAPDRALGMLGEATGVHPTTIPGLGAIAKTDNASLSNLLRQARERIASDQTTTALAVRRKPKPKARSGAPAGAAAAKPEGVAVNGAASSAVHPEVHGAAQTAAKAGPNGALAGAVEGKAGPVEAKAAPAEAKAPPATPPEQDRTVAVRRVAEPLLEPPPAEDPVRPQARPAVSAMSSPEANPTLPAGAARLVKPSSDFRIEVTPPALAIPEAGAWERVPWYAKAALAMLVAAGGGYAWWNTQGEAAPAPLKRKMDEVRPLNMAPTEWTTVKAAGAEALAAGRTLTLHKASMELTNYRVEFVGTVDHRALGWAVRVQNPGNFYAAKLRRNATGTARLSLIRWRVTNGEAGPETVLPLEMRLPSNEQYTVKLDVRGDQIVTTLQGKVIDRWTDGTLTKGGFAYLNQHNERGKIVVTTIGMVRASK